MKRRSWVRSVEKLYDCQIFRSNVMKKMIIIHDTFDHALLVNINDADELKPIIVLEFR